MTRSLAHVLLLGLAAGLFSGCGDGGSTTAPSAAPVLLTEELETADIVFHFAAGDSVNAPWQQAFHEWATSLLGVSPPGKLRYNKYLSSAHAHQLTGMDHRSWADVATFTVHTPDPQHGHEAIHLYTSLIGWPTDYFLEGLAVGLNLDPFTGAGPFYVNITDDNAHSLARSALARGELIPIESIVESDGFWIPPEAMTYPQAGSFVNFVFNEYGIDRLKLLTASIDHSASRQTVMSLFETTYGFSLTEAERRWHIFLEEGSSTADRSLIPLAISRLSRFERREAAVEEPLRAPPIRGRRRRP
jgi:hypothetical protein